MPANTADDAPGDRDSFSSTFNDSSPKCSPGLGDEGIVDGTQQRHPGRRQDQERPRDELAPTNRLDRLGHGWTERRAVENRRQVFQGSSMRIPEPGKAMHQAIVEMLDQIEGLINAGG